jgi:hypothetical protein
MLDCALDSSGLGRIHEPRDFIDMVTKFWCQKMSFLVSAVVNIGFY